MIPATTLLAPADVRDRIRRGNVRAVVSGSDDVGRIGDEAAHCVRVAVGDPVDGWASYADSQAHEPWAGRVATAPDETVLLYFTSGTTARPKLVEHTHASYPVGHLATMYWIGLQPGDVHLNVSSPGWAKHAWSCFFAPWNAGATIAIYNFARFDAGRLLEQVVRLGVTTFCAPPTVWRMLIQEDLASYPTALREVVGAGEPLNPEIIEQVRAQWGLTLRDGFGQTETCAQVGNSPGQPVQPGSMGRALPGYVIRLVDPVTGEVANEGSTREGEICIALAPRPTGLMTGYAGDEERTADAMRSGFYHTGDVASIDGEGYIRYVGRSDDVFKASDYRISPFELESVLLEHPAVGEAAVVPSPDPVRLAVPKAFVVCATGYRPSRELAGEILAFAREHLAAYKRIRRVEFAELPKTVSGKIRRVELRVAEESAAKAAAPGALAFTEDDFPELKGP
ncbi:MAG: AMP-binding protein, partial [Nocardioidaceae bacterium]